MTKCCENQELTDLVRGAIKHRAIWFYELLKSAKEQGADADSIAQKAIYRVGQAAGAKMGVRKTPREFFDGLAHKSNKLAFSMEEISVDENKGIYRFHTCALCDAWRELGCDQDEINHLCKLAMAGDYGMMSANPLDLKFNCTIGDGSKYCEMVVTKK